MNSPSVSRRTLTETPEASPAGTFEVLTGSLRRLSQGLHSRQLRAVSPEKALKEIRGSHSQHPLETIQAQPMVDFLLSPPEREYATWIRWNPEDQPEGFRRESHHEPE